MMRPLDGIKLAAAKLRAHRVRTVIITSIVALMFSGIVLVLCILAGAAESMRDFGQEGLGSRYIVRAQPIFDYGMRNATGNDELINQLSDESTRLKNAKKAEAKRLGIEYDANNDITLPTTEADWGNNQKTIIANSSSPFANKLIDNYIRALPNIGFEDFQAKAKQASAKATYKSTMFGGGGESTKTVTPIIAGKEIASAQNKSQFGPALGVEGLAQTGWSYFDTDLLRPFVLPGQSLAVGKDGSIPVVAPVSAAEKILQLDALPKTATTRQQLDRVAKLRTDIAGKQAQVCYRNQASAELLTMAKNQVDEIARNKNKRDYVAPALQYNIPTEPCGAVTVKKDTRTAEEKKQTANLLSFKRQFENYEDPTQGIVDIRLVGLVPDRDNGMGFSVKDMLKTVLQSGLGEGWFVPNGAVKADSLAARISVPYESATPFSQAYYAEFASYQDAKEFTKKTTCDVRLSMKDMMTISPYEPDKRVAACYKAGKYFDITPFGNNASAIEDFRQGVWKVMRYVAPVILFIAALVLMGVVGKIIADSRRETAVFRALGATRSSIAQIYLTYSIFIALFISALAFAIGALGAYLISQRYSADMSTTAVVAYNAADINKKFTLFGVDPQYILLVFVLVIAAALLSTLLPLLTNVRRNPIRDMRDE